MKSLIIIPAYNEEEALPGTVSSLQSLSADYEVVIINDGSKDNTAAVAEKVAAKSRIKINVINLPTNGGIGVAMQTGYLFAAKRGIFDYAIQFDADGQHDASYIEAIVSECETKKLDMCVGSRFLSAKADSFRSTLSRRTGIWFFAKLIGLLSGVKVTDPTSGFRCAGRRAIASFAERYPDDYPEPEVLFWCARNNLRVGEIPVQMQERQGGVSSIRSLRTVYYMVKVSISIFVDWLRLKEHLK